MGDHQPTGAERELYRPRPPLRPTCGEAGDLGELHVVHSCKIQVGTCNCCLDIHAPGNAPMMEVRAKKLAMRVCPSCMAKIRKQGLVEYMDVAIFHRGTPIVLIRGIPVLTQMNDLLQQYADFGGWDRDSLTGMRFDCHNVLEHTEMQIHGDGETGTS